MVTVGAMEEDGWELGGDDDDGIWLGKKVVVGTPEEDGEPLGREVSRRQ